MSRAGKFRRITVGNLVSDSFMTWKSSLVYYTLAGLLANVGTLLYSLYAVEPDSLEFGPLALWIGPVIGIGVLETTLLACVVTVSVDAHRRRQRLGFGSGFVATARLFFPVLPTRAALEIGSAIGFLLLIVPGIIFLYTFLCADRVVILERRGMIEAFRRSADLTRGFRLPIFGAAVVIGVITVFAGWVTQEILSQLLGAAELDFRLTVALPEFAMNSLLAPILAVFVSVAYHQLRERKDGPAAEDIAEVFE